MKRVVQASCPGCHSTLRIPEDWLNRALECKHCHQSIQARLKADASTWSWRKACLACAYAFGLALIGGTLFAASLPGLNAKPKDPVPAPSAGEKDIRTDDKKDPAPPPAPVAKKEPVKLEPLADKVDHTTLAKRIDQRIQQKLDAEGLATSSAADDAEFIRRAYLDIIGIIPPSEKVIEYLDSKEPDKRSKLIDELLADPKYGRHMSDIWQGMLLPRTSDNRRLQSDPLIKWLEENFNENKTWDKLVSDLVTAAGTQDKNGAVTLFLANPTADKMVDTVTRQFLGVQLQCAQCHNHPFTDYKQSEYWGMAAFFLKVRTDNVNAAAKAGNPPGINELGNGKQRGLPESAKFLPAKYLRGDQPTMKKDEPYRPYLAKWMTSAENPYFAKAMVNRMWYHFFGRGIVNPVDNMIEINEATHPELLAELTAQFTANDFDVKNLIRAICNTETYQRTSKPHGNNTADQKLYSHMIIKVMTPEQLFDSLETVVGRIGNPGKPAKPNKPNANNNPRVQFVNFFLTDEGADPTEFQSGIPQALRLMNSPQFNNGAALLNKVTKEKDPAKVVEQLFLATLSRKPTADETERMTKHVAKSSDAKKGYSDLLWVLVNCTEFTVNH